MRQARAIPGLVLLMGCAQLFGLDKTSGPGEQVDAPGPHSSLTIDRYSIGATIVQAPQDLSALTPAVFFASDQEIPGTVTTGSTWSVQAASTSVQFELPDFPTPIQRVFELPDEDISTLFGVLEHPNPVVVQPATSTISITAATDVAIGLTDTFQLRTLGSWSVHGIAAADAPAGGTAITESYDFSTAASLNGRPIEAIAPADAVLLLRYDGNQLTGALVGSGFDQTMTPAATVSGTVTTVAQDQTLSAAIDPTTALLRMGSAQPPPTATSQSWSVVAAPGFAVASNSGVLLNAAAAGSADTSVAATYTSAFMANSWHPVFTWAPTGSRVASLPFAGSGGVMTTLPVTMFTQLVDLMDASTGPLTADLEAGQPTSVTLAGMPLTTDGQTLAPVTTSPLEVTFTADVATNTLYQIDVFLLVPNDPTTPTAYQFKNMLQMTALTPDFTLPANTLQVGSSYVIRAVCIQGGFPGLSTGDLTQRALPVAEGLLDSGAFTVSGPGI